MELQIRSLSKTYANGIAALRDVTLTIPQGMYGLLGPNGAGKSTLMRTLATLQEPDEGSVRLGDIDVLAGRERVRETLGYLPQEFGVYPQVSAESLLDHSAVLKGARTARDGGRLASRGGQAAPAPSFDAGLAAAPGVAIVDRPPARRDREGDRPRRDAA